MTSSAALISSPLGVLTVLVVIVALSDALGRIGVFQKLGAAMIVIVLGALLANLRVIPPAASGGPVYDPIFTYVIPAAIFLVLLDVNLKALKRAGAPMIGAFLIGAVGTFLGVWIANVVTPIQGMVGASYGPLAGMFTGTYIGGGANFNAVAQAYDITRDGGLYTAATVVDNVMTDVWIIVTLALPALLLKSGWFGKPGDPAQAPVHAHTPPPPLTGTLAIAIPLALTAVAIWLSGLASTWLEARGITVPSILIVTTLALLVAQAPAVARLTQANTLGLWGIYLFLAVVGANADLAALVAAGSLTPVLFAYVGIVFAVHSVVLFGVGAVLKLEPIVLALASSANIGGSSTAFVLAESERRQDLVLPAILIGSIGNAIGTYAGFAMVALLAATG
ncbi:DUF819 domain-containing protein [Brevundimonas sp. DC300-4]|uniref:DUF819 family protein n=1 Tax=Brevundimonas sp. DC300-4 TaxID=2804594 RepID=UPI003CE79CDC